MDFPPKQITKLWDWGEGAWGTYICIKMLHSYLFRCGWWNPHPDTWTGEWHGGMWNLGIQSPSRLPFWKWKRMKVSPVSDSLRMIDMVERALHHRHLRSIIIHHSHLCRERESSQRYGGRHRHEVQKWFDQRLLLQPTYIIWIQWIEICVSRVTSETIAHYQLRST